MFIKVTAVTQLFRHNGTVVSKANLQLVTYCTFLPIVNTYHAYYVLLQAAQLGINILIRIFSIVTTTQGTF